MAPEIQERAIVALNRYGHTLGTLGLEGPDGETRKGQNPLKTLVFFSGGAEGNRLPDLCNARGADVNFRPH